LVVLTLASFIAGQAQKNGPSRSQRVADQPAQDGPELQMRQPPILDAGARLNPLKIALLKWYLFETTTSAPVGSQPYGVCFDGANIWTANFGDNTVTKVNANTGEVLGTFKVGAQPYGVTFDGSNIWASNQADGTVTKLRASDGKVLGTFPVGRFPGWLAFDGQNIWSPNGPDNTVSKLRAIDGKEPGNLRGRHQPDCGSFRRKRRMGDKLPG
jgi:YVTN family beta-propeller protein